MTDQTNDQTTETAHYPDGTQATGTAPLPADSPATADAAPPVAVSSPDPVSADAEVAPTPTAAFDPDGNPYAEPAVVPVALDPGGNPGMPMTDPAALAAGLPTAVPPEPVATATEVFVPDVATAVAQLNAIERDALFWGGETGVQIRNAVCRARLALTGKSDA